MANEINDLEIQQQIQKILYYISEFENGNDEYYEAMLEIIDALKDYVRHGNEYYIKSKLILFFSEIVTTLTSYSLLFDESYQEMIGYCKSDIEFYKSSVNTLKRYNKICKKTGNYPDLEAAYLLTIKLSEVLTNYYDYLKEIRSLEKASHGIFRYVPGKNHRDKSNKTNEEVEALVRAITL